MCSFDAKDDPMLLRDEKSKLITLENIQYRTYTVDGHEVTWWFEGGHDTEVDKDSWLTEDYDKTLKERKKKLDSMWDDLEGHDL